MLAPVSWYMYLKRPTYTRPHVSADIFENGVTSPRFSKKYASIWNVFKSFLPPKVLKRCKKSCVLYRVCAVWWMTSFYLKTTARFLALFSSTHRKKTIRRFQNHQFVTVFENLALRFLFPENAISFRPYVFLLFEGEIYAYRAPVDGAMDLLL